MQLKRFIVKNKVMVTSKGGRMREFVSGRVIASFKIPSPRDPRIYVLFQKKGIQGGQHFNFSKFPDFSLTFPENFL